MLILLAAIAFGPLGPPQHFAFADGVVQAQLTVRIAHDVQHDTGPVAASPSIATGSLTVVVRGR